MERSKNKIQQYDFVWDVLEYGRDFQRNTSTLVLAHTVNKYLLISLWKRNCSVSVSSFCTIEIFAPRKLLPPMLSAEKTCRCYDNKSVNLSEYGNVSRTTLWQILYSNLSEIQTSGNSEIRTYTDRPNILKCTFLCIYHWQVVHSPICVKQPAEWSTKCCCLRQVAS